MILETGRCLEGNFPYKPENCPSTHGGAGYAIGDYIDKDGHVVCCLCGSILNYRKEADFGLPKQKREA
jgi:hypothetical protein